MTPLHLAIEVGNWEAIEALLQGGADVNTLTADQRSPLHLAVVACHKEICKRFVTDRLHRYISCTWLFLCLHLFYSEGASDILSAPLFSFLRHFV